MQDLGTQSRCRFLKHPAPSSGGELSKLNAPNRRTGRNQLPRVRSKPINQFCGFANESGLIFASSSLPASCDKLRLLGICPLWSQLFRVKSSMKRIPSSVFQFQSQRSRTLILTVIVFFLNYGSTTLAQTNPYVPIDGFIAPFRSIELSSDEAGSIAELAVEEGDVIKAGATVAKLDDRVQELQVEIAQELAQTTSQLIAADQLLEKRKEISRRLIELKSKGHASQSEIIRAEMELSIAHAKVLAAQEEKAVREIELRRAEVQLDRRTVSAPFDGIVAKIHRREGEFLSPLHPEVATIIQVDKLLASFAIMSEQLDEFAMGKEYTIRLENGSLVEGTVHRIGVETDSQSGTVEIKLLIENPSLNLRSGESCSLSF